MTFINSQTVREYRARKETEMRTIEEQNLHRSAARIVEDATRLYVIVRMGNYTKSGRRKTAGFVDVGTALQLVGFFLDEREAKLALTAIRKGKGGAFGLRGWDAGAMYTIREASLGVDLSVQAALEIAERMTERWARVTQVLQGIAKGL